MTLQSRNYDFLGDGLCDAVVSGTWRVERRFGTCLHVLVVGIDAEFLCWTFYPLFARLRERRGICFTFAVLFVFLSTISRQPAGQFTPDFACGRILVPNVSSPLLGVGGPRRAEKGGNEIFVTMGVNGEFLHFGGF